MSKKLFITTAELAARWGVSISTIKRMRWEGRGPKFVRLAGDGQRSPVRYALDDVEAYEKEKGNQNEQD